MALGLLTGSEHHGGKVLHRVPQPELAHAWRKQRSQPQLASMVDTAWQNPSPSCAFGFPIPMSCHSWLLVSQSLAMVCNAALHKASAIWGARNIAAADGVPLPHWDGAKTFLKVCLCRNHPIHKERFPQLLLSSLDKKRPVLLSCPSPSPQVTHSPSPTQLNLSKGRTWPQDSHSLSS